MTQFSNNAIDAKKMKKNASNTTKRAKYLGKRNHSSLKSTSYLEIFKKILRDNRDMSSRVIISLIDLCDYGRHGRHQLLPTACFVVYNGRTVLITERNVDEYRNTL